MRVEVHTSIEPIHEVWDRIAPRNGVTLESRHLLAIERAKVSAIEPYYLLAYDADRLAGIIHGFVMKLDVASIDKSVPPQALATLRSWNPDFLNKPVFECGIVSGLGETIAANDAYFPEVCRIAAHEMVRLARDAGAEFVLVRDVPYARLPDHAGFLEEAYAPLLGYPVATLPVRWASFEEYLDALKSGARKQILPLLKNLPDVQMEIISNFGAHAERLAALWRRTSEKASDYTHETLTPAYFREIALRLSDRSHVVVAKKNGEIVAFILCLVGDEEYFGVHCGFDYDACGDNNIYLRVHLAMLRDALLRGVRLINLGITTYDVKFKRGFEAQPIVYFVKHVRQPRLTLALARGLQKGIKQPVNVHRPFKDQDVTGRPCLDVLANALPITPPPPTSDLFSKVYAYDRINAMKLGAIYSFYPPFETAQGPVVRFQGREVVMLGSNAYLGLATHPSLISAAKAAIDRYGTGCSGSPLLNGTLDIHVDLAQALAEFMRKEDAILFSTGYQTNVGVVSALLGKDDVVIMDRLNHASLVDGARLVGAEIVRFHHNDMDSLEHALKRHPGRGKFVVVDSVFSMEGTIADLPTIVELSRRYGARTMVDEAHAIGVLGPGGRGAAEQSGVLDKVDILMGTFSKSLASIGGFVAADAKVVDYLRHVARSHIFSASLPPAAVATVRAALEIIKNEPQWRRRVLHNAAYMSSRLQALGFEAPFHGTAVVPVRCNNDVLTLGAFKRLLQKGVFVNPVLEPAVPKGREVLRTSYMATHTEEMLDRALAVFAAVRTSSFPRREPMPIRSASTINSLNVRPMVLLPVADRRSLSRYYIAAQDHGLLRVPGFTRIETGQTVDCGISLGREDLIVQAEGLVVSKCLTAQSGRPLGIDVRLLPSESSAWELLQRILCGDDVLPVSRRSWRYHAGVDVEYVNGGDGKTDILQDIGFGGASIRSCRDVKCGNRVPLRFRMPAGAPIDVMGEVRWRRQGEEAAYGVRFCFSTDAERERMRSLIGNIQAVLSEFAA